MDTLRPRVLQFGWRCVCCALVLCCLDGARAQTPTAQALGSLRATGEVYLNTLRATGDQTVFPGDTVRTGADGAAALSSPGFGLIIVPARSEVSFRETPYLATLRQGSLEIRFTTGGKNLGVQFGNNVAYFPPPGIESAAVVTILPDGRARVACSLGVIGVRSVDGVELVLLHANESVSIGADGKLQPIEPGATTSTGPVAPLKSSHNRYILVGAIAGGGAAAAAIALIAHKSGSAVVSPSSP